MMTSSGRYFLDLILFASQVQHSGKDGPSDSIKWRNSSIDRNPFQRDSTADVEYKIEP
jgi:hypothetical protein